MVNTNQVDVRTFVTPPGSFATRAIKLEYLAEGNANVVYTIRSVHVQSPLDPHLKGKLLRVRKDKTFIQPTRSQHAAFAARLSPLFHPSYLVKHDLIPLKYSIISQLNQRLKRMDDLGVRPTHRRGDVLAEDEESALLVTDMTAGPGELFFEIKPKWLLQSPDAPKGATRCRTCALRAHRQASRNKTEDGSFHSLSSFCPLALVSDSVEDRRRVWDLIVRQQTSGLPNDRVHQLSAHLSLATYPLLTELRDLQSELDKNGILNTPDTSITSAYLTCMTLRDCILLIRTPSTLPSPSPSPSPSAPPPTSSSSTHPERQQQPQHQQSTTTQPTPAHGATTLHLADLDLKAAHPAKIAKWRDTERALRSGGAYFADVQDHSGGRGGGSSSSSSSGGGGGGDRASGKASAAAVQSKSTQGVRGDVNARDSKADARKVGGGEGVGVGGGEGCLLARA